MKRILGLGVLAAGALAHSELPQNNVEIWGNGVYRPRPNHPEDLLKFTNFSPKLIADFPNLSKIRFGPTQVAGLDAQGQIYIWPKHTLNSVKLPEVDDRRRAATILTECCGFIDLRWTKGVLFALNRQGEVWQWRYDQSATPSARQVPSLHDIKSIASGHDHFAAVDGAGAV